MAWDAVDCGRNTDRKDRPRRSARHGSAVRTLSRSGRSAVSTWIFSIARFKALNVLQHRPEAALDEEKAAEIEDEADDPEVVLAKKDKAAVLRQCLAKLSAEHREIVSLVYYQQNRVEEVAAIVGIPESTVKTRMFYARKKLSELLTEQGIERVWPGLRLKNAGPAKVH